MNIYKNHTREKEVAHQFYIQAKKTIPVLSKSLGLDVSYFISTNYDMNGNKLYSREKKKQINFIKQSICYSGGQIVEGVNNLISSVRDYREKTKSNSIGTDGYMKKFDLYKKSADQTKEKASRWWRDNNSRTSVDVKSDKEMTNGIAKGTSTYSNTEINISPLWYHRVYKHGLTGVVYKGRPCFVLTATPYPVRRLQEDNIEVHKVSILHSHGGDITMISDMWLASFIQQEYLCNKEGVVLKPSERVLSVSPELRRAETIVSQRIGRNVIGNLLS